MWRMPDAVAESRSLDHIHGWMMERLKTPDALLRPVSELNSRPDADSYDILELKDGRTIERFSGPKRDGGEIVGRVWTFHEITDGSSSIHLRDGLSLHEHGKHR